MLPSTNMFIGSLEKWMRAIQASDLEGAKFEAEHMKLGGELLAIHPEFRKCFQKRCDGIDSKEALRILTGFLLCTIEGRAHALNVSLKDTERTIVPPIRPLD